MNLHPMFGLSELHHHHGWIKYSDSRICSELGNWWVRFIGSDRFQKEYPELAKSSGKACILMTANLCKDDIVPRHHVIFSGTESDVYDRWDKILKECDPESLDGVPGLK